MRRSASSTSGRLAGSPQRSSAFCIRFSSMSRVTCTGLPVMGWKPDQWMSEASVMGVGMKSCTCCGFQRFCCRYSMSCTASSSEAPGCEEMK